MNKTKPVPVAEPVRDEDLDSNPTLVLNSHNYPADVVRLLMFGGWTTSTQVAARFGHDHGEVLRQIRKVLSGLPKLAASFRRSSYRDAQGKRRPQVAMDASGFLYLLMCLQSRAVFEAKVFAVEVFIKMGGRPFGSMPDMGGEPNPAKPRATATQRHPGN